MSWKDELYKLDMHEPQDLDAIASRSTEAKTMDVGFVNPNSGAGILGRENGDLEGFADYGLGFRFSKKKQSLMVFAPNIHVFSPNIQKHDKVVKGAYLRDELHDVNQLLNPNGSEKDEEL